MNLLWFLPLILVGFGLSVWLGDKTSVRFERTLNRISRVLFGRFVSMNTKRALRIEAAYIDTTYRTYAAKTLLFAVVGFVAGAFAGAYLVAGLLHVFEPLVRALAALPRTMTRPLGIHPEFTFEITSQTRWLVLVGGGLLIGVLTAGLSYLFRWQLPASDAEVRRRGIDGGLTRTTAFMYALSRGGLEFPQVIRLLTDNRAVYGEPANEMSVAVREMDLFGRDMISALQRMARRTPSEQFKTFSENLTSVLQSGSNLPTFFRDQYERFHEEEEDRQEEILELLATIAEGYVTVLVAGMLFFITILLVFGMTVADTLWLLQLIIYLIIPLANAGFAVFLQQRLDALGIAQQEGANVLDRMQAATPVNVRPTTRQTHSETAHREQSDGLGKRRPDGGFTSLREAQNRRVLELYDRIGRVKRALRDPLEVIRWNPTRILWVVVPIALLVFLARVPAALQADGVTVRVLDDLLVQSVLLVLVPYAVVRYFYRRRIDRIEKATPELLERLASLNEAGMSVVNGLDRVRGSDLGVLTPEVERIWRDIEYGSNADDALVRFGRRVRTMAITRVVTLLTNAMRASGNMGPVLRIAAEQARAEVSLKRRRMQTMVTYLVVIYISFFVFLVIILAVNEVLVPSLPETVPTPTGQQGDALGASPDAFARFGEVDQTAYTLIFFHAALIQGFCAGFVAGQLGEGSLRDGAKHAAIMLGIAYLAFVLLTSPIASITVDTQEVQTPDGPVVYDATTDGERIYELGEVSLSDGGFLAVYDAEDGIDGTLYGHTAYLPPGTHTDVVVPLFEEITEDQSVRLVVHRDTNNNQQFDFQQPYLPDETQVDRPYSSPAEGGEPGIEIQLLYVGE